MLPANTNFGESYCYAGNVISQKCRVPYLYRFEIMGTAEDVVAVREGLAQFMEMNSGTDHHRFSPGWECRARCGKPDASAGELDYHALNAMLNLYGPTRRDPVRQGS